MIAQQSEIAAVGGRVEHVAGGRQVGEGEDPGRGDPDRQDPRARRVRARRLARRAGAFRRRRGRLRRPARSSASAPRRRAIADPHQQHRPWERRARLHDLAVPRSRRTNARLDQWLTCPGVFPRSRTYAPRATLSIRHSGSRGTETSRCRLATRAISATPARDRGRARAPRSRRPGRTHRRRTAALRRGRPGTRGSRAPAPPTPPRSFGSSRSIPTTRPPAEPLRPLLGEHALAAADVEHGPRRGLVEQLVERALEARHQPAHDRVVRAVLVEVLPVGTAGSHVAGGLIAERLAVAGLIPRAPRDRPASAESSRGAPGS